MRVSSSIWIWIFWIGRMVRICSGMGVPPEQIAEVFCGKDGLYLHQMNGALSALVREAWAGKDDPEIGALRYLTVRLLHELMTMPAESEPDTYFTRSQIAIVKRRKR